MLHRLLFHTRRRYRDSFIGLRTDGERFCCLIINNDCFGSRLFGMFDLLRNGDLSFAYHCNLSFGSCYVIA